MHPTVFLRSLAFAILGLVALAGPAHAVDGVKLINQSVANNGGLTPGDGPGFPVEINTPGSYRLTSNLTVPNANIMAIEITASNVTLDLNGFSIFGPVTCPGIPLSCSPFTNGPGVFGHALVGDPEMRNVTVMNGGVVGFQYGVALLGTDHRVERVHATQNYYNGIDVESGILIGNTASFNGRYGLAAGRGGVITGNTSRSNLGGGISGGSEALVVGNSASSNGGYGLRLSPSAGYTQNVVVGNNGGSGLQVSGGINLGHNVCGTDAVCP